MNTIISIIFAVLGTLSVCAALANWDWFFNSQNGRIFVKLFRRNGARVFYALLGLAIWAMAIAVFMESR